MKTSILAGLIALVAAAGFAQAPVAAPAAPPPPIDMAAGKAPVKSSCTASCGGSATVSCSGSSCSAVDRNCGNNERGHVTCGTTTTYCAASCSCDVVCTCGVPCFTTPCVTGTDIQDCSSWGICATSCYCGGECLQHGGPPPQQQSDDLLSKIFG
jgi:hypothetical protein